MRLTLKFAPLFLVVTTSTAHAAEINFVMAHGSRAFAATLGAQCLSTDQGTIEASGDLVKVKDKLGCANEIREIADNWITFASEPIVTMTGSTEALTMVREKLEHKFGRSPNAKLRFLAQTQNCRCLAFVGKRQEEASDLAASLLPKPMKSAPAKRALGSDRILHNQFGPTARDLRPSQDLIKDMESTSVAPPSA